MSGKLGDTRHQDDPIVVVEYIDGEVWETSSLVPDELPMVGSGVEPGRGAPPETAAGRAARSGTGAEGLEIGVGADGARSRCG